MTSKCTKIAYTIRKSPKGKIVGWGFSESELKQDMKVYGGKGLIAYVHCYSEKYGVYTKGGKISKPIKTVRLE